MDMPQGVPTVTTPVQSQPTPSQPLPQVPIALPQETQPQTAQTPPISKQTSPQQPASPVPQVAYAGFTKRSLATLIDGLILVVIATPINLPFAVFQAPLTVTQSVSSPESNALAFSAIGAAKQIVMAIINLGYGIGFLSIQGATPGKMALGLKVVDTNLGKITVGKAVKREAIGKFVSGIVLGLGYLWVIWDGKKQGWHDKIAGTVVVYKKSLPTGS